MVPGCLEIFRLFFVTVRPGDGKQDTVTGQNNGRCGLPAVSQQESGDGRDVFNHMTLL